MDSIPSSNRSEDLAARFSDIWNQSTSPPDVFAFLESRPDLSLDQQLEVILVDQRQRWRRGIPLPLRVYLSACPAFESRGNMLRAMAEVDRNGRHQHPNGSARTEVADSMLLRSQALTEAGDDCLAPLRADQQTGQPTLPQVASTTPDGNLANTRTLGDGISNPDAERLSFVLDEQHLIAEESGNLKALLNDFRFTLIRRLGAGGMGVVYEAYDQERGELLALKTMRQVDPQALVRFKQEFRSLSDISHPNLVSLYELFSVADRWFFTMELIEGEDFVSYVLARPGAMTFADHPETTVGPPADGALQADFDHIGHLYGLFDETRLREALGQLAEGILALHNSGKLHRDIKPTNVLVTPRGRVVLLDFGLTTDLRESTQVSTGADRQIVGTLAHMSPEQAVGQPVNTASDWYSVGVMLYEVLTGRLPFTGQAQEIVIAKRTKTPPPPSSIVAGLPEDLEQLCVELLDRDPAKRPPGREIIQRLRGRVDPTVNGPLSHRPTPLIGRNRHHRVLDSVFTALLQGRTQSVFVFGRAGTGKTALIRAFLDQQMGEFEAVVLAGRCHERESVPYKALDSLIDALARHLKQLDTLEVETLLTSDVALLARLFPVLSSVAAIAKLRQHAPEMPDPQELRRRALDGLRGLLEALGRRTPLILSIDDLQWGDFDSALLLSDLICSQPCPRLLLIGSFRSEDADRSPFLREMRRAISLALPKLDHRELAVETLTQSEARELALILLGRDDALSLARAHLVARESGGNPLFIDELVKHIQAGQSTDCFEEVGLIDLDKVLWARIQCQTEAARTLLGIVAVSGRPIKQTLAFQASNLGTAARTALASLRTARLIRYIGQTQQEDIDTYHNRIRATVLSHLPAEALREHHERLANTLAESGIADPEILAPHYRGAGRLASARDDYERAADSASAALAFDHAAQLCRTALELPRDSTDQTMRLWTKLGDALANAGRGAEAAQAYLEAAEFASGAQNLELKRLASTQLLLSGHLDDGLSLLKTLLAPLGLRMPTRAWSALLSMLAHRAILRLRGLSFRERQAGQISPMQLARIDLCWSAVAGLSMTEPVRGADFQARGLLLALNTGEPFRIARALAMEAAHRSTSGIAARPHVEKLLSAATRVAQPLDSPHANGIIELVRGISAIMFGGWKAAHTSLEHADHLFRNYCTGVAWERDTVHNFLLWTLLQMGEIAEFRRRWAALYREAQERGDLYANSMLTTLYMTTTKLANNEPIENEAELESMFNDRPASRFNIQHTYAFDSLMHIDLYRGNIAHAWTRINEVWPEYVNSFLLKIQIIRVQMLEQHGRVAVALAERTPAPAQYLSLARQDAQRLAAEGLHWATAHSLYLKAAIAACEEDSVVAVEYLRAAENAFDLVDMPMNAQLMRYRMSEALGGEKAHAQRERIEAWLIAQGIVSPARWAGLWAPGFGKISSESIETSF